MSANPQPFTLAALVAALRLNAARRPLWKINSVADFLDLDTLQVTARIQDGRLPYAFNIGNGQRRAEPRILALSVLEIRFGPHPTIGATKNLKLPAVINLILPARDLRSTELKRLFSCQEGQVYELKKFWRVARLPKDKTGPYSYTVFNRASVADWLAQRRMA